MSTQKTADDKPKRGWWPFGGSSSDPEDDEMEEERGLTARKGRATPGRRDTEEDEGNVVVRSVGGVREYIEGVQSEISKVTWPTRDEVRNLSAIVLAATFLSSVVLGLITLGYSDLFKLGLAQPMFFLGFFVIVIVAGFVIFRRSQKRVSPY